VSRRPPLEHESTPIGLGLATAEYAHRASTPLPRPAELVAAALKKGCDEHQRQRDLVRASLIARG
jgi:hypothetical protein